MKNWNSSNILLFLFLFVFLASCKTTEEARKERLVNDLSAQMEDSKKIAAESDERSSENRKKIEDLEAQFVQFTSDLEVLKADLIEKNREKIESLENELAEIKEKLKEQAEFIKEVLETLKKLGSSAKAPKTSVKSSNKDEFDEAYALFAKKHYTKAMPILMELLNSNKLDAVKTNKTLYALGVINHSKKKYEDSITYLSKIITKYPKSSLAPESYLFIGKSLEKLDKKDEAKEAYKMIIENYPDSREVKEAKELLK